MAETRTTCPYCGVGCGVIVLHDRARITGVRGDPDHPANHGQLCTKGRTLHLTATPAAMRTRLLHPQQRAAKGAPLARVAWDTALDGVADRFAACIREHGPDSVAFYLSGQLLTEDYYVFNKLAKGLVGTNNVDTNSRLCMSSAVAGYKETLGADAPPACYDDVDHARCLFIAGSNTAWAHPVLYRRIEAAKARNPALRIVVVDPRATVTAAGADLHLAIEPGTDVALFHGMLHLLLWDERVDRDFIARHTAGFDALKAIVRDYTPRVVAQACGITEAQLAQAAQWFAEGPTLSLYCQGLNQSTAGTAKNAALVNLHLATGQIGKPGAGPFSLTGQPNAMGGREVGGLANLLPGHRDVADAAHRAEVASLWGVPDVPARPGLTAVELFAALAAGTVKMVWIACTNPAQSMPDQATVRAGLARAELVVLQEACATTETAAFADVLLPASTWGEKEGTVTNSERRISRVRAALAPPGEARADWAIAADFARGLEARLRPAASTLFPYATVADVFAEHAATTRGRDLDIGGLSHARLDAEGPRQWPCADAASQGTARLYTDHAFATPDGRARFAAVRYVPVAEPVDARYPFRLNTGRLRDQWHGMSRTGAVAALFAHAGGPALEMHPADLARRGVDAGDLVRVESRRGEVIVPVVASEAVKPGAVFLPMHWGSATLAGRDSTGINAVTSGAACPSSRQPELKHAAVRIAKANLPWPLVAVALPDDPDDLLALRERARAWAAQCAYASVALLDGARPGVLLRAAHAEALTDEALAALDRHFALDGPDAVRYDDRRRAIGRRVRIVGDRIVALRLSGDVAAEAWLTAWLADGTDVRARRAHLVLPGANPPDAAAPRGRVVCNCLNVGERAIVACATRFAAPAEAMLAHVQAELGCGTQCGSCLPEVKQLLARAGEGAAKVAA
ncbi:MAG: molybdopterin-dependent oxidoreductase [Burkholderiales bacterium]